MTLGKAIKRRFCCGGCGFIFESSTETTWADARPGDYWFTAQGNIAACPKCRSYAHEIFTEIEMRTAAGEDEGAVSMTIIEEIIKANAEKYRNIILDAMKDKKEVPTMQVTYNGFTGELLELKRSEETGSYPWEMAVYNLTIYDREKQVTHSFTGVKLESVKFLGGKVTFGG